MDTYEWWNDERFKSISKRQLNGNYIEKAKSYNEDISYLTCLLLCPTNHPAPLNTNEREEYEELKQKIKEIQCIVGSYVVAGG